VAHRTLSLAALAKGEASYVTFSPSSDWFTNGHSKEGTMKRKLLLVAASGVIVIAGPAWTQSPGNAACELATASDLEAVLGSKVSLVAQPRVGPSAEVCTGTVAKGTVVLRRAKRSGKPGAEQKGMEIARQMGAKVDVKTFGAVTCSTLIPPPNFADRGFNTTCSAIKGGVVAAIEVTAKEQKDMVPIDKLRPIAEKFLNRL
jgi:hypothetical protein